MTACDVCGELLSPSDQLLTGVLPLLLQNYREKNTALKSAAELGIYKLIQGNAHMKVRSILYTCHVSIYCPPLQYVSGLLGPPVSRQLEDAYSRIQAKQNH